MARGMCRKHYEHFRSYGDPRVGRSHHGHAPKGKPPSREYRAWCAMNARCYCLTTSGFERYGGRGITVCDRWRESFTNFLADVGICPPGYTLDRYPDNKGNYEPGNVRWATTREQSRNKSSNRPITIDGVTHLLIEWAEMVGMKKVTLGHRLRKGMDPKAAVFTPVKTRTQRLTKAASQS